MKLSVSAYQAQAAAHKKILSNSNYQSSYGTTTNPQVSLASSILQPAPPTSTTSQDEDENESDTSKKKSSLTTNNKMNTKNDDQNNSDDQSLSLNSANNDSSNEIPRKHYQKNKTNQRWMKLRTTVQISSAMQKKPSLKREDSFLKRFSTRPPAVAQETIEDTCSDGPNSEDGNKSWFTHSYQKRRRKRRMRASQPISVVNPDQEFYFYWLLILTICVLYNLWTLIVRQSFPELQALIERVWVICDAVSDLVFILDIGVQLRTGYLEQGLMVYNSRKLACHYIRSKSFVFDICALVPLDLLQIRFGTNPLLRFPRFFKVYRAVNYYYMVESRTVWPNLWRVINLIHILLILAHWFGCFYFLLSEVERFQGDWVYPYRPGEYSTLTRKYLGSLYWATLTLTTIGDLPTPETNLEYLFTIVSYLIGVFIFATIVGQVGNVITNRNANRLEFERLLDGAKTYMRHHKVPSGMKRRVLRWYDYSWSRGRIQGGGDINTALGLLPDKLKTELALHVNLSVLKKVTIFQECQPEFLHDLVLKMKAYIFTPGDTICRKGEVAREMFIIADGILEVLNENGKVLTTMKAGDFFGEIGILNLDGLNKRTADVRSVGYSELFSLSREDVLTAMKDYPEAQEILQSLGRKRLMEVKSSASKKKGLNQSVKLPGSSIHHNSIVDKIKHETKLNIRSVLKKNKTTDSTELIQVPSSNRSKGLLRRMSHVKSEETNTDDDHGNEANHNTIPSTSSSSSSSKNVHPIGAGLPLLARLKLLKERQDHDEKLKCAVALPHLSILKEISTEDHLYMPQNDESSDRKKSSTNKVNFASDLVPIESFKPPKENKSSWSTLKKAAVKDPVTEPTSTKRNSIDNSSTKDYESIKDLSPELSKLPFVKKLKILNERQQLRYLRSLSLDPSRMNRNSFEYQVDNLRKSKSDTCLHLFEPEKGFQRNIPEETTSCNLQDNMNVIEVVRGVILNGLDDIFQKLEGKFDSLYEAIESRDYVINDMKLKLDELEKYSRESSLETVIQRPRYSIDTNRTDHENNMLKSLVHKQDCPMCSSETIVNMEENSQSNDEGDRDHSNWELEMLAEQLSQKEKATDKRSLSLDYQNSVEDEDSDDNEGHYGSVDESNRLLRHKKKHRRRRTVTGMNSNESDI